jgi:methylated-DNA-[protein]-cysteine S-methyltransferase
MGRVAVSEVAYDVDGWGRGTLWLADGHIVWHELPTRRLDMPSLGAPRPTTHCDSIVNIRTNVRPEPAGSVTLADEVVTRIQRYFAGASERFDDVPIDLEWCTDFQRAVTERLRAVPYGEVVTYGELAALAGYPNAQRAAGTFCAGNRLPLFLPCHRVVAAHGLGGYGSLGAAFKRRLLALEGVSL